jgi:predicted  nucleic acid-binding Zn-ribbon protein
MGMERTLWTDERIDDAMERIEKRFDEIERRLDRVEAEISALRREMHQMMLVMVTGYLTLAGIMLAHWA